MTKDNITVLLVEDNRADVVLLMELLPDSEAQSWQIKHCDRLTTALDQLQQTAFDVVLLDLSLPDSQGLETVVRLQAAAPHIPTVVLTGLQDKTLARQAVAQGAQDYLVKGQLSSALLVKKVEYAIERAQILQKLQSQTLELAQANEQLQQREREFRTLVENTPDIIARFDGQLCCLYVNPANADQLGLEIESCPGKSVFELGYPPEMAQFLETALQTVFDTRQTTVSEFRLLYQGAWKSYQTYLVPEFNADQAIESVLTIARDITQLRQTEAAFAQAEVANRMKDEFLATLSHELRTPLNPILGWTNLLQTGQLSADKTQVALETIARNVQRQAKLVEDLLEMSQMMRGQLSLELVPVRLNEVVQAAIATVQLTAEAKAINLEPQLALIEADIKGNPVRLQQLVWNLLTNAIKFTPRGGQVIVRLEQVEQDAQLTVADNGKGINASFLPFVFDRFSQEDNSLTRQFGGLGLGLALARQLAEAHGGTITAFSAGADQGATFTVRLPLLPAAAERVLEPLEAQPKRSLHGTTILLVEDEPDSQDLIVEILTDVGANIVAVGSADEALEALPQGSFDVLVSDIGLPFTNGYRLMQQVRQIVSAEALPAVAFTAYAGSQNRKIALEVGYQEHLSKPVDPQTLVSTIANLLKLPIA